jgi:hypothetical protein
MTISLSSSVCIFNKVRIASPGPARQAQLDMRDESHGMAPLALAAAAGRARAAAALLDAGADPEITDEHGKTALLWAAGFGHAPVVAELLRGGGGGDSRISAVGCDGGEGDKGQLLRGVAGDASDESAVGCDEGEGHGEGGADGGGCAAPAAVRPAACLHTTDCRGWDAFFHACHGGHLQLVDGWIGHVDLARTDQSEALLPTRRKTKGGFARSQPTSQKNKNK